MKKKELKEIAKKEGIGIFVAKILMQQPGVIRISVDKHGWASVQELIDGIRKKRSISKEILDFIVTTSNKPIFEYSDNSTKIRTRQIHSFDIVAGLKLAQPPNFLFHGTSASIVGRIKSQGLSKMKRDHVQLSEDINAAVVFGKKYEKFALFCVNTKLMRKDGFEFILSRNNVWLTEHVSPKYLHRMTFL